MSADYRQLAGFKSKKEGTMSVTGERNELSSVNAKLGMVEPEISTDSEKLKTNKGRGVQNKAQSTASHKTNPSIYKMSTGKEQKNAIEHGKPEMAEQVNQRLQVLDTQINMEHEHTRPYDPEQALAMGM